MQLGGKSRMRDCFEVMVGAESPIVDCVRLSSGFGLKRKKYQSPAFECLVRMSLDAGCLTEY